jgi:hypothetical protein
MEGGSGKKKPIDANDLTRVASESHRHMTHRIGPGRIDPLASKSRAGVVSLSFASLHHRHPQVGSTASAYLYLNLY